MSARAKNDFRVEDDRAEWEAGRRPARARFHVVGLHNLHVEEDFLARRAVLRAAGYGPFDFTASAGMGPRFGGRPGRGIACITFQVSGDALTDPEVHRDALRDPTYRARLQEQRAAWNKYSNHTEVLP